jgi:hypothetical protein
VACLLLASFCGHDNGKQQQYDTQYNFSLHNFFVLIHG